ncbi:MAG: hypothetical protein AVDCRST_MAG38-83 [uncultured Solirubrobacteraceae bacterium]|uniref:Tyr recombinase domain-containing protein n=1 Tax=uncultured Solirubrobacteraceae bacterium TaxID=1162706 RepID=A0A6J4R1C5_9ACTN|nr:MAG: hypothetical protein AVDCRST_MAG38-83 [uncultured Solirubrobacteraceae bacterium]
MKFAVDRGWREDNPVEATRQRREDYDDDGDVARYTPDQVEAIVAEPASEQDRAAVTIAAFAGLRRGEILALRWKNVDFTARKLRVRKTTSWAKRLRRRGAGCAPWTWPIR